MTTPHPAFGALWFAWSLYMVVCLFLPTGAADVVLWATWALTEGIAGYVRGRPDTHSEVMLWTRHFLALPSGPLGRGWLYILFLPYIAMIGLNLWSLFEGHGVVMERTGAAIACSVCVGLTLHWGVVER